jgi:LysR family transcriptional regulator, hydrogen peroxide-inducible genes activator
MEMHQIRYFLAVGELLNFTRAAEKCNVSQPALTRAIQGLEHELGGPLFHRERSHTHLTELGKMMRPFLETMLRQTQEAKQRAKSFTGLKNTPLTVGVMCTIGPNRLLDLFAAFAQRNTGIRIRFRDLSHPEIVKQLTSGELDVAILAQPEALDELFHGLDLFEERFVVGAAPSHRFSKAASVRMADLDGETYLGRLHCEFWVFLERKFDELGAKLKLAYRSEREDWVQAMIKAGFGVACIPESAVIDAGIITRKLVEPEVKRVVQLVTVRGRPQSPAVGAFVREAMRWRNRQMAPA